MRGTAIRLALPFALLLSACGGEPTCGPSDPCPAGSFCEAGECVSECDPRAQACAVGVCTSDGRCARTEPDPDAGVCAAMVLDARFGIPTVTLLVDQSGSMDQAYSGGSRWDVLQTALIDPTDGVVTQMQGTIRFGLTLYTNLNGPGCPDLVVVPPALNNRDAIALEFEAAQPEADTPTGESIDAVVQDLLAFPESGRKYIIVATDGEPDTCADPNGDGMPTTVASAQAAFTAGIHLFIISVGEGVVSAQHLQDMANAGVGNAIGGPDNAPYYEASDATQLQEAFAAITGSLLTCELTVNGTIAPEAIETGIIYLDGSQLNLDDPNGWEPIDDSSFRLLGSSCSQAQRAGGHTVTAEFGCEASEPADLSAEGGGVVDPGCAAAAPPLAIVLALAAIAGIVRRRRNR